MAGLGGEVWFKLDSATATGMHQINRTRHTVEKMHANLRAAALICPTWLQTCIFANEGQPPSEAERDAYLSFIDRLRAEGVPLRGVLLYGLARNSMQPEAARLSILPQKWMQHLATEIEAQGVAVKVSY
jgi:hypothetical protein